MREQQCGVPGRDAAGLLPVLLQPERFANGLVSDDPAERLQLQQATVFSMSRGSPGGQLSCTLPTAPLSTVETFAEGISGVM